MIYTYFLTGILSAAMAFSSAWKIQDWRFDAKEKQRAEQLTKDVIDAGRVAIRRADNVIDAQNKTTQRMVLLRNDAANARAESDRLRDDLATIRRQLPGLADNAVRQYADTATVVFDQCQRSYQDLAGTADGHASDVKTLSDAWPK